MEMNEAINMIRRGAADVLIFDTPVVDYSRANDDNCSLTTAGKPFGQDAYGIALPKTSWLKEPISRLILKYMDSGVIEDVTRKWYGQLHCFARSSDGPPQQLQVWHMHGLFLTLGCGAAAGVVILVVERVLAHCVPRLPRSWHQRRRKRQGKVKPVLDVAVVSSIYQNVVNDFASDVDYGDDGDNDDYGDVTDSARSMEPGGSRSRSRQGARQSETSLR
ncbi:PREDICTED: glutamate receptor ionotropic, NMDA 3B-like [Priapulus caudatus]|uniref:Glutamate receptor ionotropic, NMDA 3B-like n=1 Tax=Priapulus caudatus TaxID=37621 RepID=A0ABM1DYM3_PRICU|nr:PREDICTED: glutamate receptor ionotropic, NMDA 3B-like [Priapulus caudatus]